MVVVLLAVHLDPAVVTKVAAAVVGVGKSVLLERRYIYLLPPTERHIYARCSASFR